MASSRGNSRDRKERRKGESYSADHGPSRRNEERRDSSQSSAGSSNDEPPPNDTHSVDSEGDDENDEEEFDNTAPKPKLFSRLRSTSPEKRATHGVSSRVNRDGRRENREMSSQRLDRPRKLSLKASFESSHRSSKERGLQKQRVETRKPTLEESQSKSKVTPRDVIGSSIRDEVGKPHRASSASGSIKSSRESNTIGVVRKEEPRPRGWNLAPARTQPPPRHFTSRLSKPRSPPPSRSRSQSHISQQPSHRMPQISFDDETESLREEFKRLETAYTENTKRRNGTLGELRAEVQRNNDVIKGLELTHLQSKEQVKLVDEFSPRLTGSAQYQAVRSLLAGYRAQSHMYSLLKELPEVILMEDEPDKDISEQEETKTEDEPDKDMSQPEETKTEGMDEE